MNLLNKFDAVKSKENNINKTKDTITCINSKENKLRSHDLKNHEVESKLSDRNAKGASKTKTFIIIYLKEYEKTKFSKDKLNVLFINPSIEKIFREDVSIETLVLIVLINSEKLIFLLNKC